MNEIAFITEIADHCYFNLKRDKFMPEKDLHRMSIIGC